MGTWLERFRFVLALWKKYGEKLGPIIDEVQDLIPVPDWSDPNAVRHWCLEACDVIDVGTEMTPTTADDLVAAGIRAMITSDTLWAKFQALIWDRLNYDADPSLLRSDPRVAALADDAKIDPTIIIMIIEAIYAFYKWWKNRQTT